MVRIGSGEAPLAQRARDVWVDGLIRQYTYLHPEVHGQRMSQHIRTATQLSRTIAEVVVRLADTLDQVSGCNIGLVSRAFSPSLNYRTPRMYLGPLSISPANRLLCHDNPVGHRTAKALAWCH